jgi:8-amino-7-oxononanoate synthase
MQNARAWNQRLAEAVRTWTSINGESAEDAPLRERRAPEFSQLQFSRYINRLEQGARLIGLNSPFFRSQDGRTGSRVLVDGQSRLNFAWCNYLGLNEHPSVAEAARRSLDRYGTCVSASRMVAGEIPLHRELEEMLAHFCGLEAALLFVSGHAANVSTIGTIMTEDDLIVHDALVHNSAMVGARLSRAHSYGFRHNDPDDCERVLRRHRDKHRNALVVIEGLYSTEGDLPDLARFVEIKERYGAWLMVDDAHGLGVLGARGRGCAEHCGIDPRKIDILMGTLSKTLASCGGYIAGSRQLIDILRYSAPGFVYSVGLPPSMASAALASLNVLAAEPERVARLRQNGALFLARSRAEGFDTASAQGLGIIPIIIGNTFKLGRLEKRLFDRGIVASPIFPPGVPINTGRLRFFVTSEHTEQDIELAVDALQQELHG